MLLLAGILGLLGVGGAALLDFSDDSSATESDDAQPGGDTDTPVIPANQFLEDADEGSTDSGVEQHLEICDFIDLGGDQGSDGETDTPGVGEPPDLTGEHLTGTEEANIISGSEGGDQIDGLGGDDQLNGYDGDDALAGGEGDDTLHGAEGDDSLAGGTGDDLLHGEYGDDALEGGEGDDRLFGHFGTDTLLGGDGADVAHGGQDDDSLHGGAGDDALHGNDGADSLQGGAGQDTLFGGAGDDLVWGADDGTEADFLNGGDGDDTLVAGAGDLVTAGAGADQIWAEDLSGSGEAIHLMDFDSAEDQLVVFWDPDGEAEPEISIDTDPEETGQQIIRVNGAEVLRLTGAEELSISDIALVDTESALLFGNNSSTAE